MRKPIPFPSSHRHKPVATFAMGQREGVPYEVKRVECKDCHRVLEERPVRRAAA
jgi:RNase P subunit RPR2